MTIEFTRPGQIALRQSGFGPILALPDDLACPINFDQEPELRAALQIACDALTRFQVAGDPLPPGGEVLARLEAAISTVGERARLSLVQLPNYHQRLYDMAFDVSRTADAPAGLVHGLLIATRAMLNQLGKANTLYPALRSGLPKCLALSICAFAPGVNYQPRFAFVPLLSDLPPYDPLERWVEGHHILFGLCQAAEYFFVRLAHFQNEGDNQAARGMILAATEAFDGVGHSFALAGDFTAGEYNPGIVDRMVAVHKDFSGLWFADHAKAKVLAKHTLQGCPMRLGGDAVTKFTLAFHYASSSHAHVCAERAGADEPSLLQKGSAASVPGPVSLRQVSLKNLRVIKAKLE